MSALRRRGTEAAPRLCDGTSRARSASFRVCSKSYPGVGTVDPLMEFYADMGFTAKFGGACSQRAPPDSRRPSTAVLKEGKGYVALGFKSRSDGSSMGSPLEPVATVIGGSLKCADAMTAAGRADFAYRPPCHSQRRERVRLRLPDGRPHHLGAFAVRTAIASRPDRWALADGRTSTIPWYRPRGQTSSCARTAWTFALRHPAR